MLAQLISLPISAILFIWMLRIKKDDPFPKGSVAKMLITGALCIVGTSLLATLIALAVAVIRIGPADVVGLLSNPESEEAAGILARIQSLAGKPTLRGTLINAFVIAALLEEGLKYLAMRLCMRRPGTVKTRMDVVLCGAIVGLGFQVVEDILYAGDVTLALVRAITPFHFVFGVVMGYYYGKFLVAGSKSDHVKALLIPILIHGLFDFSVQSLQLDERFVILALIMLVFMLALTVVLIVKLRKWCRDGAMTEPIAALKTETV